MGFMTIITGYESRNFQDFLILIHPFWSTFMAFKLTTQRVKYDASPFMENLTIQLKTKRLTVARGSALVEHGTGEITGVTEITQVVSVDSASFVKLYTNDLAGFFDLSRAGVKALAIFIAAVQEKIGTDLIFIPASLFKTRAVSRTVFYRGVDELIEKKFIAKHVSDMWYFINPNLIFNGDRARFVRDYRRNKNAEVSEQAITEKASA